MKILLIAPILDAFIIISDKNDPNIIKINTIGNIYQIVVSVTMFFNENLFIWQVDHATQILMILFPLNIIRQPILFLQVQEQIINVTTERGVRFFGGDVLSLSCLFTRISITNIVSSSVYADPITQISQI